MSGMDSAQRMAFHGRLDALLDRRERIEAHQAECYARGVEPMPPPGKAADLNARNAYAACFALLRDLSGPMLPWLALDPFQEYPAPARLLLMLRDRLALAGQVLEPSGDPPVVTGPVCPGCDSTVVVGGRARLDLAAIGRELLALAQGDTSDLFAPAPRVAGQPAKRHQISRARLRALELDRLRAWENSRQPEDQRVSPAAWRQAIVQAFGASGWAAIEKWEGLCRRTLGGELVSYLLTAASMGMLNGDGPCAGPTADQVTDDGQRLLGLTRASKGESRRKRRTRGTAAPMT